jgi:hypothetical protein
MPRQIPMIDWAGQEAARAVANAQVAAVEERVRKARLQELADMDPLNQIVRQLRGIDARGDGFDRRFALVDEQARMLVGMVGELRGQVRELEGRLARFEGPVGRFRRRKVNDDMPVAGETNEEDGRHA